MYVRLVAVLFLLLGIMGEESMFAQLQKSGVFPVAGVVVDGGQNENLPFANVQLRRDSVVYKQTTANADGKFHLPDVAPGNYSLRVSYIGYDVKVLPLHVVDAPVTVQVKLSSHSVGLHDVVITATEKKSITSTSVINRQAMEHLQPSSLTDLLALLPGGSTKTPNMGSANSIQLREVGTSDANYNISSLGTKFMIDGATLGTDANMQYVPDATQGEGSYYRSHVSSGIDMRTISTDNIESVEVIRGIPSVKYGDLTSGVVKITRKSEASPLEARFKADQYGKLVSVGKGVDLAEGKWSLNADGGFFSSRIDPRNRFENYNRVNFSLRTRYNKLYPSSARLMWNVSTDYSGNIDNVKTDPEVQIHLEDRYKSSYHQFGLTNTLYFVNKPSSVWKKFTLVNSLSLSLDKIEQTRFVALDRAYAIPLSYEPGVHDGYYLPYTYTADYEVDGKPFYSNTRLETEWGLTTGAVRHRLTVGSEWQYNKNFGAGQKFDQMRPYYVGSSRRPRAYRDIPATNILSFYAEEYLTWEIGRHQLEAMAGVRSSSMLNIDKVFAMHGEANFDPRLNLEWTFPTVKGLSVSVSGGVGRMSKSPTILDLYPEKLYMDFTQLNYWNENPDLRRMNIRTYVIDQNNYSLKAAHNLKWEGRMNLSYKGNQLSITYFKEKMTDGFRNMKQVQPFTFTRYDASSIDGSTLTAPPSLENLASRPDTLLRSYMLTQNGSSIIKEGVEFQYSSPRIKVVNTQLTVNGAWFRTLYENSRPEFYDGITQSVNGILVNNKFVGLYNWKEGYHKSRFTSNFIADTYWERLGLIFSATAECYWFGKEWQPYQEQRPMAYMDVTGTLHPYTDADAADLYKQWLNMKTQNRATPVSRSRFYMCTNFKMTKNFGKFLTLAFFADRILNYAPDYEVNGFVVRRSFSPYFGMELNVKL